MGIYHHLELSLKLQITLVCSQFLLSLSIVPNNGCKVNKHFLLLLPCCNLDEEGGWGGLEADIREALGLAARQFSKNLSLSSYNRQKGWQRFVAMISSFFSSNYRAGISLAICAPFTGGAPIQRN